MLRVGRFSEQAGTTGAEEEAELDILIREYFFARSTSENFTAVMNKGK